MEHDITPIEVRSGVISDHIITVLLVSTLGALAALSTVWWFAFRT